METTNAPQENIIQEPEVYSLRDGIKKMDLQTYLLSGVILLIMISLGFVLVYLFKDKTEPTPRIFQVCLTAPDSKGCQSCQNQGETAEDCTICEELLAKASPENEFSQEELVTLETLCQADESLERSSEEEPLGPLPEDGQDWAHFSYTLPDGEEVSGFAPTTHAFGTDYATSSDLGNSFSFGFGGDFQGSLKFTLSEALYHYYEDELLGTIETEDGRKIYKFTGPDQPPDTIYYTDSYETAACSDFNIFVNEPTSGNDACGTGFFSNDSYIVTCNIENLRPEGVATCDEIIKRISFM